MTTWAFQRTTTGSKGGEGQGEEVAERLREFWLEPTSSGQSVASFIPQAITSQGLQIRTYDLGQPAGNKATNTPPREPRVFDYTTSQGSSGTQLPREVAVTMSFYAGRNLPRQRGRVFIGPLTSYSLNTGANVGMNTAALQNTLNAAAERLSTFGMGTGDEMEWSVLSQADGEIRVVTAGWVDNAFDTIRARGPKATFRASWAG